MADRSDVMIITYNGVDGACAGAMALLKYPKAQTVITSAARIGRRLSEIAKSRTAPSRMLVCGLGVYDGRDDVLAAARSLRRKGAEILWYCGRRYLETERGFLTQVCTPVFVDARTNTDAVSENLDLAGHPRAEFLRELALHDTRVQKAGHEPSREERFWLDRIDAAISMYLKYQDEKSYAEVLRRLATDQRDSSDEHAVEVFRRWGFRYILQGHSPEIQQLRREMDKVGATDEPVLILGESGVGKEHVAHLIHERSRRAMEGFVAINCAVFTGNAALANSILFGHLKGAFTGADKDRAGAFVQAHGGVLYLDEFGELPLEVQAKLLRIIEDGHVTPEGADLPTRTVDVRVLASTNRDLPQMIRKGQFRADLYHRLSTLRIHVPPLRDRMKDVESIIHSTLSGLNGAEDAPPLTMKDYKAIYGYDWPGNVRQLITVVKRAVHMGLSIADVIEKERELGSLVFGIGAEEERDSLRPRSLAEVRPMKEVQEAYTRAAWELHGRNNAATARALGLAVNTLKKYLREG